MMSMSVQGRNEELKDRTLAQTPDELWSRHDTDVGLVITATPVHINSKLHVKLPRKSQGPLKEEAV